MSKSSPATQDGYLRIEHVTKRFMGVTAVENANISIARGEFFSLLGPSGCGKTTLLRMIAGFEFPTEGAIYMDGQDMSAVPANKRPSNMVFQSYAIFPHLNVHDNIAYGLRRLRLSRREVNRRVEEALAMIHLPGLGKRRADQLSGGQRQRIALARALVNRPKVLLLDEPLGALDKKLRESMQLELRELQRSVGITFVFVTHDQEEALSMSDRIAVMFKGKVLQVASPRALYEAPNCREVADFIGSINFFEATVRGQEGGDVILEAAGLGTVRANLPAEHGFISPGARVIAAIRPEKILLLADGNGQPGQSAAGVIGAHAYLGDRDHLQVALSGRKEPVAVAAQQIERALTARFDSGQKVTLGWDKAAMLVLPG